MWSLKTAHRKTDILSTRIISIFLLPVRYLLLFMRIRFFWRDRKKNTFSAEKRNCDFLSRKVFCFYYLAQLFLLLSFFWSTRVLKRPRHPFCPKTGKYRHRLYLNLPIKFMRTKKAQRGRGYLDFLGGGTLIFWEGGHVISVFGAARPPYNICASGNDAPWLQYIAPPQGRSGETNISSIYTSLRHHSFPKRFSKLCHAMVTISRIMKFPRDFLNTSWSNLS